MMRRHFMMSLCTAVLTAGLVVAPAAASVVSVVNFDFGDRTGGTYTGVGVAPDTGTYWNGMSSPGTTGPALESDGVTASSVTVEVTPDTQFRRNVAGNNLLDDWFITNGESTFTSR